MTPNVPYPCQLCRAFGGLGRVRAFGGLGCAVTLGGLLRLGRRLDGEKLHLEDERGVRADVLASPALAVGQLGRHEQLPLGADLHQLQGFRPPGDHLVGSELRRLAALVGAVELLAADQSAAVVNADRVRGLGQRARSLFDDLVLQAAGKGNHAGLRLVGHQEGVAFLLVLLLLRLGLRSLAGHDLLLELTHRRLHVLFREDRLGAGESGAHAIREGIQVQVGGGDGVAAHAGADGEADDVADFLDGGLERRWGRAVGAAGGVGRRGRLHGGFGLRGLGHLGDNLGRLRGRFGRLRGLLCGHCRFGGLLRSARAERNGGQQRRQRRERRQQFGHDKYLSFPTERNLPRSPSG